MNVFSNTHLPKDGWIQGCFYCGRPTSNTINYNYKELNNTIYCCLNCEKDNHDKNSYSGLTLAAQIKIKSYIDENTLEPFKTRSYSLDPPIIKSYHSTSLPAPPPPAPPPVHAPLQVPQIITKNITPPETLDNIV